MNMISKDTFPTVPRTWQNDSHNNIISISFLQTKQNLHDFENSY